MKVEVIQINQFSTYLEDITSWNYHWWGIREGLTKQQVRINMEHSVNINERLPKTYVAIYKGKAVGMYQFSMCEDLESRPDLYPWLINVYVDENYRNLGVGKALMESVKENALKAHLKELYLYTRHIGFYERFGWQYIEDVETFREDSPVERLYYLKIE